MATIKHLTSKNSNYAAAESYLTFQHNEYTGLPILDEKGRPKLRDSYLLDALECGESSFAMACLIANRKYGKNGRREDVKTHHYIISFDPKDAVENGLTMEKAQALGFQFCKDNFPGHPAIVCTHPDGHNSAGNIHVHIVIGSLRVRTVERQPFMDKPCDWEAGKKHRCTSAMLRHLRVAVMEMCEQADLNQINLLEAQGDHVSEREYWAQRRGQRRLDHANAKLAAEGQQPTQTVYQTELDKLRKQIYAVLNKTTTFEEFSALLMQEHGIAVKESRGRLSYCPPSRTKFITAKKLSKKLEKEQVLTALSQNIQLTAIIQPSSEKKPDKIRKLVDIQAKVAAGKGIGYERWAKKFNLKRWSQTLCLLQEKKLLSEDALTSAHCRTANPARRCTGGGQRHGCPHGLPQGAARASCGLSAVQAPCTEAPDCAESRQVQGAAPCRACRVRGRLRLFQGQRAQDTAGPQKAGCRISDPFLGEKRVLHPLQESADRTA